MTTSVVATSRGRFTDAIASNPAGVLAVVGAILLLTLRPRNIRIPVGVVIALVAGMWLFELFRFSVL